MILIFIGIYNNFFIYSYLGQKIFLYTLWLLHWKVYKSTTTEILDAILTCKLKVRMLIINLRTQSRLLVTIVHIDGYKLNSIEIILTWYKNLSS